MRKDLFRFVVEDRFENFLKSKNIGYVRLSGDVAVKNRGKLIDEFADNPDCLVFLSTEAGEVTMKFKLPGF